MSIDPISSLSPAHQAFYSLWASHRRGRSLPGRSEFGLAQLGEWAELLVVAKVQTGGAYISFTGARSASQMGQDLIGSGLQSLFPKEVVQRMEQRLRYVQSLPCGFVLRYGPGDNLASDPLAITALGLPVGVVGECQFYILPLRDRDDSPHVPGTEIHRELKWVSSLPLDIGCGTGDLPAFRHL